MKSGQFVTFDLYVMINNEMVYKEFKGKIIYIEEDSWDRDEEKAVVEVDNQYYTIPFSRIKEVFSAMGEQLTLDLN